LCPRPHELQLGEDRDLVRERGLTAWERVVPVEPELAPVDGRAQAEADPLVAVGIGDRRTHGPGDRDRLRDALDRQLAGDREPAVAVEADLLGGEAELRVPLGVEEVGRLQVGGEVLVPDIDARDPGAALERGALALDRELGSDLVELALEPPGQVGNLEVDPRVNGVEAPGSGRGDGQNRRTHRFRCSFRTSESGWIYLHLQTLYRIGCCVCKYHRNPTSPVFSADSWLRSCRARADWRPGTRSCGHMAPSCAASRLFLRRRRGSDWRTSMCSLSWRARGVSYA